MSITNSGAGHHVPTDFPGRQLILVLSAEDEQGQPLQLTDGSTVPEWGGAEAGLPGTAFAKVLQDVETGESPVVSYWKQTQIESDNRIPALETDTSNYYFSIQPGDEKIIITANLKFRRLFQDLADEKGWDMPDVLMEEDTLDLDISYQPHIFFPLIFQ